MLLSGKCCNTNLLLWGGLLLSGLLVLSGCGSNTPPALGGLLRGEAEFIMRLPAPDPSLQEDIKVVRGSTGQYHIIRGPSNRTAPGVTPASYTRTALNPDHSSALQALRQAWCQQRPHVRTPGQQEHRYAIALLCVPSLRVVEVTVAESQLPDVLRTLIRESETP